VNGLRARLGLPPLEEGMGGYAEPGGALDTMCLQQLSPELVDTLRDYERVVFVDAHVDTLGELVRHSDVLPGAAPSLVSHHMTPAQLLALSAQIYGRVPATELISVRGTDFNFGEGLSPETAAGTAGVIEGLWQRFHPS
jgi:Ni,Fe-hydrogenase maturation factor